MQADELLSRMFVFSILDHVALPFLHGLDFLVIKFTNVTIPEIADGPLRNLLCCKFLNHVSEIKGGTST